MVLSIPYPLHRRDINFQKRVAIHRVRKIKIQETTSETCLKRGDTTLIRMTSMIWSEILISLSAELLTSRLKQWNLLDPSIKVAAQRKRHLTFSSFFTLKDGLCFCHNVIGLFETIGIDHNPNEWRLFIDSSFGNLKAVLLNNENKYLSLLQAHSVDLKRITIDFARRLEIQWVCLGGHRRLQNGGIRNGFARWFYEVSLLCLWDSRDTTAHYHRRNWPQQSEFTVRVNKGK